MTVHLIHLYVTLAGLQMWVERANLGMFSPEMLLPMGLPEDVTVIALGVSNLIGKTFVLNGKTLRF